MDANRTVLSHLAGHVHLFLEQNQLVIDVEMANGLLLKHVMMAIRIIQMDAVIHARLILDGLAILDTI